MKFGLPSFTQRNLGRPLLVPGVPLRKARGGPEVGPVPDFAESEPGALGDFVALPAHTGSPRVPPGGPRGRLAPPRPLDFGQSARGDLLGQDLVAHYQASPGAFFLGRTYHPRAVRDYLGASSWLRAQAREGLFLWSGIGWTTKARQERYELARDQFHLALREGLSYPESVLHLSPDQARHREYEDLLRAGVAAGDLPAHDPVARGSGIEWPSVRETVLGMRLFTEEQVGLLCPWRSRDAVSQSIRDWAKDGLVRLIEAPGVPMPVWKVTDAAAEDGLAAGLYDSSERAYRARYRSGQELHDLAVGDAILLLAMEVQHSGGRVMELRTELAMMAEARVGAFADFAMAYELGGRQGSVEVEVVGLGNNYRTGAKAEKVRSNGFRVYVPGFDGQGVRLA